MDGVNPRVVFMQMVKQSSNQNKHEQLNDIRDYFSTKSFTLLVFVGIGIVGKSFFLGKSQRLQKFCGSTGTPAIAKDN